MSSLQSLIGRVNQQSTLDAGVWADFVDYIEKIIDPSFDDGQLYATYSAVNTVRTTISTTVISGGNSRPVTNIVLPECSFMPTMSNVTPVDPAGQTRGLIGITGGINGNAFGGEFGLFTNDGTDGTPYPVYIECESVAP